MGNVIYICNLCVAMGFYKRKICVLKWDSTNDAIWIRKRIQNIIISNTYQKDAKKNYFKYMRSKIQKEM